MIHGDEINLNLNQVYIHSDSGSRKVLYTPTQAHCTLHALIMLQTALIDE